jgi:hypothetical protein
MMTSNDHDGDCLNSKQRDALYPESEQHHPVWASPAPRPEDERDAVSKGFEVEESQDDDSDGQDSNHRGSEVREFEDQEYHDEKHEDQESEDREAGYQKSEAWQTNDACSEELIIVIVE